ncbi:MAG: TlpA disulfide reductase family protein [Bacteroidota bacterium]
MHLRYFTFPIFKIAAAFALSGAALFIPGLSLAGSLKGTLTESAGAPAFIYLYTHFGNELIKTDSAAIKNSAFEFKNKTWPRGLYTLAFTPDANQITLVLGEEDIELSSRVSDLSAAHISGSRENDAWNAYKQFKLNMNVKLQEFQGQAQRLPARDKDPAAFDASMNRLKGKFDSTLRSLDVFNLSYAGDHPKLFVGKMAQFLAIHPETNRKNYWKKEDFNNDEMLRGSMYADKVSTFFQKFVSENLDEYMKASEELANMPPEKTQSRELMLISLIDLFKQFESGVAYKMAKRYAAEFPKSARAKNLLASFPPPSPELGESAPDITLNDREGKSFSLSALKGQVVLIDFWASWCGPCRMENPNVVRAYDKYKSKGFTVLSVSLDNNRDKWLAAIEKDGLKWPNHISDLKGWQSAGAQQYKVNSIPATFLVGKDGKIIGKNLRGAELEMKLSQVLDAN